MGAKRVGGAQHHGGRRLADGKRADGRATPCTGERGTHPPPPVDGRDGGAEKVEKQRPARIGTVEGDNPLQRSDRARGAAAGQVEQALGTQAV